MGPTRLWNMGDVPFVKLFTKSIGHWMSEIYGSVGFAGFRHLSIAPTSGLAVSGMRERPPVAKLTRLGAQAVGA